MCLRSMKFERAASSRLQKKTGISYDQKIINTAVLTEEMAQRVRAFAALVENWDSFPSIHIEAYNHL